MYIIEGNIGAGKTTLLRLIEERLSYVKTFDEPLTVWDNKDHGSSLLTHFYQDTPRWAFTMEMFTIMCRVKEHMDAQTITDRCIVMERSLYSGYYCFALNSYKQGFMGKLEWEIYKRWFNYMVKDRCKNPSGFIYLKTNPEIAYERAAKRNREGEEEIPLSYFKQIDERLELFLVHKQEIFPEHKEIPVLVLDCDQEFEHNEKRKSEIIKKIEQFFAETHQFVPAYKKSIVETEKKTGYF